jgi:hypothetical protein
MNADPKTSRVVDRSDGGEDLYPRPKRRRSQGLNSLPVGKDLSVLVAWHPAVPSDAAQSFAVYSPPSAVAYRQLRPQEKRVKKTRYLFIHYRWPVLRGGNRLLLLHGLHCFFCLVAGRAAPI